MNYYKGLDSPHSL